MMRALAHPARLAILDHLLLNKEGTTATECAEVVGLSPSATSYHLRALARTGMIEEAPSRGDGRERVWRRKQTSYSFSTDLDTAPEEYAAQSAMAEAVMAHQNERVRRYLGAAREQGSEWYNAASLMDLTLAATAEELADLLSKIKELVDPFNDRQKSGTAPPGSRAVTFQLRAVPLISRDMK